MDLSIAVSATSSNDLEKCLRSVSRQGVSNIDVIVNNATDSPVISQIVMKYKYREIKLKTNILLSRYITVKETTGDYVLIMDDTRRLADGFINALSDHNIEPVTAIAEYQEGVGPYANLLRSVSGMDIDSRKLNPERIRYILPRLYRRDVVMNALSRIRSKLPADLFASLEALDLELIYYEAFAITRKTGFITEPHIIHKEVSYLKDIKKMFKYGKSTRLLRKTTYKDMGNLGGRFRFANTLGNQIDGFILMLIRGLPFFLGYVL